APAGEGASSTPRPARPPRPKGTANARPGDARRGEGRRGGKPAGGGQPDRGGKGKGRPASAPYLPKPKPKPLIPLTDSMKKGKEPLRTFGDLKQFLELKPAEPTGDQPGDAGSAPPS